MDRFDITFFFGPQKALIEQETVVRQMAECGIRTAHVHYDTETNRRVLTLLKKYGMRATLEDSRIYPVLAAGQTAAVDGVVEAICRDYADFDNICEFDLKDEPDASEFGMLGAFVEAFRRRGYSTCINLFPNYAKPEQLGTEDYPTHLERFLRETDPDFLSYDHYHFRGRKGWTSNSIHPEDDREDGIRKAAEESRDRAGFFSNLEIIREKGLQSGKDYMLIVLLTEHGPYRYLSRPEILWEMNMCLAYGCSRLSYFTYGQPEPDEFWSFTNALVDLEGQRTAHYYDAKAINAELYPIGEALFHKKSTAVYHIGAPEPDTRSFVPFGKLTGIDGANGVLGVFADGSMYLVNRDHENENTFTLHITQPLQRFDGRKFVPFDGVLHLEAGAAALLR